MNERVKYPRTYHLPWSEGRTDDDKVLSDDSQFIGKYVVVTEKMDGENTTIYSDGYLHDIYTGEKTRKVREEELECHHGWEPLAKKFKKKRRVVYDYIEIEPEGE